MTFSFVHNNINVLDLERSLAFYRDALGLHEAYRRERDGYTLVFITDDSEYWKMELTWLHDRKEPYDLGDNEIHIALTVDDFDAARALHREMGVICHESASMSLYFIEDPDGYWIEILPLNK